MSRLELESEPQKQLKETAIAEMQKLMNLVQRTTVSTVLLSKDIFKRRISVIWFHLPLAFLFQDLYHELHALDRFEQEYRSRLNGKGTTDRFEKGRLPIYNIVFHFRGKAVDALCHLSVHYLKKGHCGLCPSSELKRTIET